MYLVGPLYDQIFNLVGFSRPIQALLKSDVEFSDDMPSGHKLRRFVRKVCRRLDGTDRSWTRF